MLRTLRCRKLTMIRSFIKDKENGVKKPWHTFIPHMLKEFTAEWGGEWHHMLHWDRNQQQGDVSVGNWNAIATWWRDAWKEWLKLRCLPIRNSIPRTHLRRWPIWNNRTLAKGHGIASALRNAFTNSTTRAYMTTIRKMGFITFSDFMHDDGNLLTGEELYTTLTVHLTVHNVEHVVPQRVCNLLMRVITALWGNAERMWINLTTQSQHQSPINQWIIDGYKIPFSNMKNKTIAKVIRESEPRSPTLNLLKIRNQPINICWKREQITLSVLAPSRRDLVMRIIRNALPIGAKRVHWGAHTQKTCLLCDNGVIETVQHLFWDCSFAKETWRDLSTPWRTHRHTHITWDEVIRGHEVRIGNQNNTQIEQAWAIVRACVMRTIWFERNRRFFYPDSPCRTPTFRHNQCTDDIKIHIECWALRAKDKVKENISKTVTYLQQRSRNYDNINITNT